MSEPQSQPPQDHPRKKRPRGILLFLAWVGAFIGMNPGFKPWEPETDEDEDQQEESGESEDSADKSGD